MPPVLSWLASLLLMAAGLAGSFLPGIPGTPLILAGVILHKLLLPRYLSWWTVGLLAFLAFLSCAVEAGFAVAGGKTLGAGRWGLLGAGVGATIGLFFGPLGLLLGAFAGAVTGEMAVAKRPLKPSLKAGLGAGLGLMASVAGRLVIALVMVAVFVSDCLF